MPVYEAKCIRCGRKAASSLWCDDCLAPYRKKGRAWERRIEANRAIARKRQRAFGW